MNTTRSNISGSSPYEPIIGFSRAVRIGQYVHVSGTGPVGADDLDVAQQADRCFRIIADALKQTGASMEDVYRTRMFLTRTEDWQAVGDVHGKFFSTIRPAATMVVVKELLDPRWKIEIEVDALMQD